MNVELPSEASLAAYAPEKERDQASRKGWRRRARCIESATPAPAQRSGTIGRAMPTAFRARRAVDPDDRRRRPRRATSPSSRPARRSMPPIGLKRVYYFRLQPDRPSIRAPARRSRRRLCASTGSTRRTGCCASMASRCHDLERGRTRAACSDLDIDPKLAWALEHRGAFPGRRQHAPTARCCCGCRAWASRAVDRIIAARRTGALRLDDVARLSGALARARPFIIAADWQPGRVAGRRAACAASSRRTPTQLIAVRRDVMYAARSAPRCRRRRSSAMRTALPGSLSLSPQQM